MQYIIYEKNHTILNDTDSKHSSSCRFWGHNLQFQVIDLCTLLSIYSSFWEKTLLCLWLIHCYYHSCSVAKPKGFARKNTTSYLGSYNVLTSNDNQSLWCNVLNFPSEKCKKYINAILWCLRETHGNFTNSFDRLLGHFNVYVMNMSTVE